MKKLSLWGLSILLAFAVVSCNKDNIEAKSPKSENNSNEVIQPKAVYTGFPETFEAGTKTAYAVGDITVSTGSWNLNDALIGNTTSDRKNGTKSVRIQNTGMLTMNFNVTNGASNVSITSAVYGTDAASTWDLWYSTNNGTSWTKAGGTMTTSSTTLATSSFALSVTGTVRFQLRKLSGGRLNVDDFRIDDNTAAATATRDDNMAMGNPSGATTVTTNTNNYLMVKTQYALAYNNSRGIANWVSWHLSTAWKGTAARCDCFTSDASLPSGYFKATTSNYTGSGFDRGHLCPSDDRDGSSSDNAVTFLMTNIMPQAPNNNQITWGNLEDYSRKLITQGYELYIIAGSYGQGGTGSNGTANTINGGTITVPARVWKVIVVLPIGTNDVNRVTSSTRVIAVDMPNTQTVNSLPWGSYRTTVDAIEAATGYNILSNVSAATQTTIEAVVDNGPTS